MIFVINLTRRPDRWRKWKKEAETYQLPPYQRWEAVDAKQLTPTPEIKKLFRNNDFFNRSGVIACALSHYQIWQHIVKEKFPETIIFEDDANFITPLSKPNLPEGWDLFYYGGFIPTGKDFVVPGIPVSKNIIIPQIPKIPLRSGFCAYAYMLSYAGAQKLVSRILRKGIYKAIDYFMVDAFEELSYYCYSPATAYSDLSGGTDVQNYEQLF
jgi:glycosyl transferase, family 25